MAEYKSKKETVAASARTVYEKLSNLGALREMIDNVPADRIPSDKTEMLKQINITSDSIVFPAGPAGEIRLQLDKLVPYSLISLAGVGTPVPLSLRLDIEEQGADTADVQVALSIDIPKMLQPMVGGTLQKMVDQFGSVLTAIRF